MAMTNPIFEDIAFLLSQGLGEGWGDIARHKGGLAKDILMLLLYAIEDYDDLDEEDFAPAGD